MEMRLTCRGRFIWDPQQKGRTHDATAPWINHWIEPRQGIEPWTYRYHRWIRRRSLLRYHCATRAIFRDSRRLGNTIKSINSGSLKGREMRKLFYCKKTTVYARVPCMMPNESIQLDVPYVIPLGDFLVMFTNRNLTSGSRTMITTVRSKIVPLNSSWKTSISTHPSRSRNIIIFIPIHPYFKTVCPTLISKKLSPRLEFGWSLRY